MKRGHIPQRTCLICRIKTEKSKLCRLVFRQGVIVEDDAQVMNGRGVYCCNNSICRKRLEKHRKGLKRAFRLQD